METYFWVYVIVGLIVGVIFGYVTKSINEGKGYDGGFAWGFWLGVIGIIVVACRQNNPDARTVRNSELRSALSSYDTEKANAALISKGGWKCHNCKRVNAGYVTTCICGMAKDDSKKLDNTDRANVKEPSISNETDELAKYKKMYDDGIISEEEYQAKRKQILKL